MISWCAFCQQFQGERQPFDDFELTHGMCKPCAKLTLEDAHVIDERIESLKELQDNLYVAGRDGDISSARDLLTKAATLGARPVDLFMGLVAPLLYKIGVQWQTSQISVEDEHRFTAVYAEVLRLLKGVSGAPQDVKVLLINALGNRHFVAIDLLEEWYRSRGITALALKQISSEDDVLNALARYKPRALGISVAMADQVPALQHLVQRLQSDPKYAELKIYIGGNLVKNDVMPILRGTTIIADPNDLFSKGL